MSKIDRFEDTEAWKKARTLVGDVYGITGNGKFFKDFALRDQIRRATISIISTSPKGLLEELIKNSASSCLWLMARWPRFSPHFYIALDQKYVDQMSFKQLYERSAEISRMLSGLIKYLRNT